MMTADQMRTRRAPCFFGDLGYFPIDPRPDADELLEFRRVVLRHHVERDPEILIIEDATIVYGWVIGLAPR